MSATIDKIRKLLNLANNASAAPNEAETARILAERLMNAAGISEADLSADGEVDPMSTFDVTEMTAPEVGWHGVLAVAVARIVGCFVHRENKWDKATNRVITVRKWVGTAAQREAAVELHSWTLSQVERLAKGAAKIAKDHPAGVRAYMGAYRRGLASAIAVQAMRITEAHDATATVTSTALARRTAIETAIDAYCDKHKINRDRKSTSRYSTRAHGALRAGYNDGQSVRLQRDVAGNGQKRLGSG